VQLLINNPPLLLVGNVDEADIEKQRIEQKQRSLRKKYEAEGGQFEPKWFQLAEGEYELDEEGVENSPMAWKYTGKYWQTRESQNWPTDLLQLW
jgi:hypothetical protein